MRCFVIAVLMLVGMSRQTQAMRLTSNYGSKILWRMYNPGDLVHVVPWAEGTLEPGATALKSHPEGSYQLEIRRGSVFGRVLVAPVGSYSDTASLTLTADGKLVATPSQAISIRGNLEFRYLWNGAEIAARDSLAHTLFVSGTRGIATVSMQPLTITKDVVVGHGPATIRLYIIITPSFGTFDWDTGTFTLPGTVVVQHADSHLTLASGDILMTTGSASSGGKFAGTGVPYNSKSRSMVLVAGGNAAGTEYLVTARVQLLAPAPPLRCPATRPKCCEPLANNKCGLCIAQNRTCP